MFEPIFAAVFPVLALAALGYAWTRGGGALDSLTLTPLIADIGTPCLVIATFAHTQIAAAAFASMAAATLTAIAGFGASGALALWLCGLRLRTFLPSIAFPNAGNLGLPLALYAFGNEGLGYAIVFFAFTSIFNNTIGQAVAAGTTSWRALARMPIVYGAACGLALAYWHIALPVWLDNTVTMLANLTVPLMLLLLGAALGRLHVRAFGRAALVASFRILLGGGVGWLVALLYGLDGTARAVLILQCAMPVAVFNYLFAARWGNQPEDVAGAVVVSTLASVVTVPILLDWLLP